MVKDLKKYLNSYKSWCKSIVYSLKISKLLPNSKLSFSQSGEDLIIKYIFDSIGIKKPSYIDIGAHHPYYLNNTAHLHLYGSKGINIEPDPILFEKFKIERKEDINLNIGIANTKSELSFYIMNVPTLNTFSKETAEGYEKEGGFFIKETIKVSVESINDVIKKYANGKFPDFLNLDAEGIDEIILQTIDYKNNAPKVICVETASFSMKGHSQKNNAIISLLENNGYLLYADTNINSIFVKKSLWER